MGIVSKGRGVIPPIFIYSFMGRPKGQVLCINTGVSFLSLFRDSTAQFFCSSDGVG